MQRIAFLPSLFLFGNGKYFLYFFQISRFYRKIIQKFSLIQMQHPRTDAAGKFIIMRHDKHELSRRPKRAEKPRDLYHAVIIQSAGRFIEHQEFLFADHADCDRHTLFLTTGYVGSSL